MAKLSAINKNNKGKTFKPFFKKRQGKKLLWIKNSFRTKI